jgi:hypothetical protein
MVGLDFYGWHGAEGNYQAHPRVSTISGRNDRNMPPFNHLRGLKSRREITYQHHSLFWVEGYGHSILTNPIKAERLQSIEARKRDGGVSMPGKEFQCITWVGPGQLFVIAKHLDLGEAQVVCASELHTYIPAFRAGDC